MVGATEHRRAQEHLRHCGKFRGWQTICLRVEGTGAWRWPLARATVLVVDDEEEVRRAISRILTRAGFEVLGASGGSAAVLALRTDSGIDVMVTDLEMPGLSGEDLLNRVRETDPGLPIVVLSGRADPTSTSKELG